MLTLFQVKTDIVYTLKLLNYFSKEEIQDTKILLRMPTMQQILFVQKEQAKIKLSDKFTMQFLNGKIFVLPWCLLILPLLKTIGMNISQMEIWKYTLLVTGNTIFTMDYWEKVIFWWKLQRNGAILEDLLQNGFTLWD